MNGRFRMSRPAASGTTLPPQAVIYPAAALVVSTELQPAPRDLTILGIWIKRDPLNEDLEPLGAIWLTVRIREWSNEEPPDA
jgi:hypothetical protein